MFRLLSVRKRLANQGGQGTTEYVMLVILVSLVLIPMVRILPAAIREYIQPFYYSISRPLP